MAAELRRTIHDNLMKALDTDAAKDPTGWAVNMTKEKVR